MGEKAWRADIMDGAYDCIVLGTGLTECIISGMLSVSGLKVLHMDRNNYYGGASASLNLDQLYEKFRPGTKPIPTLGASKNYNVDIIPKFIMADGILVKILLHTGVTKYLEFKSVEGSFVVKGDKIHKVPASDSEAAKSSLMNLIEKKRCRDFFLFVQDHNPEDASTHGGIPSLEKVSMKDIYDKFKLSADTRDFIGHALALHRNEDYVEKPASETIERVRLYMESLARYSKSPYIYPLYGLGDLPQGFARLSAIYGGTYMLNKKIDEIIYDESGAFVGVRSGEEVAKAKFVVGDPSYFPKKTKKVGEVVRAICILNHPINGTKLGKNYVNSSQIIIPQNQVKRHNDIYISIVSDTHKVCETGKYVAIAATTVETSKPEAELEPALKKLGDIEEKFVYVSDIMEPLEDGKKDRCYISKSYDATTHFETTCEDVLDLYKRITGKDADLTPMKTEDEE